MGKLADRKTRLVFETEAAVRSWGSVTEKKENEKKVVRRRVLQRSVIVEIDNGWHGKVRLKGTRKAYPFSFEGLYHWVVEQEVRRARAEKKKLRDAKKKR